MTMKLILVLPVILLTQLLSAQSSVEDSQDRIYWSKNYTLEWIDFVATPPETNSAAALSSIALPYSVESYSDGKTIIQINTCFVKSKSWVIPKHKNNLLLQHEQLHFDIAELNRRKIVKAISEASMTIESVNVVVNNILAQFWSEDYKFMQEQYDSESNYSLYIKKQIEWNKKVAEELEALKDYKYTEIVLQLNQ
jgi:hypothetical protein